MHFYLWLIINFPKNRLNYYTGDDYDDLLDNGLKYMNKAIQKMGSLQHYYASMPLIIYILNFNFCYE